jgi:hypothetical protein
MEEKEKEEEEEEEKEMGGACCSMWERREMCAWFWCGELMTTPIKLDAD